MTADAASAMFLGILLLPFSQLTIERAEQPSFFAASAWDQFRRWRKAISSDAVID